jgi:hypothetical protein
VSAVTLERRSDGSGDTWEFVINEEIGELPEWIKPVHGKIGIRPFVVEGTPSMRRAGCKTLR